MGGARTPTKKEARNTQASLKRTKPMVLGLFTGKVESRM
jgi:hypothetical protein